jgi:hypothetical protein
VLRRHLIHLGACAALLLTIALGCLPGTATAAETATIKVGFSPDRLGSPTTIEITGNIANPNGGVPGPVTSFTVHLPPELELVASTLGLAICQPSALLQEGLSGCSPNARLGTGTATVEVPFGPEVVSETANIDALMGPPAGEQLGVLLYAESQSPVAAQVVFPGVLLVSSGSMGESLNTIVPITPTLPGAAPASVSSIHLSVGPDHLTYYKKEHGKTVSFRPIGASLPAVCPRGGFHFLTELSFLDGTNLSVPSTVPCPPSHRHPRRRA